MEDAFVFSQDVAICKVKSKEVVIERPTTCGGMEWNTWCFAFLFCPTNLIFFFLIIYYFLQRKENLDLKRKRIHDGVGK